jgi:ankyrin repeat protein
MLLKSGAGPNIKTDDGQTPVHVAAKHGNLTTLMLLLDDGGDPLRKSKVMMFIFLSLWILQLNSCSHL